MTEWYYAGAVSVKVAAGQNWVKVKIVVLSVWLKRVDVEICVEERARRKPNCQLRLALPNWATLQCLPAAYPQIKDMAFVCGCFRFRPQPFGKWICPKCLRGCTVRWVREILSWNCERKGDAWTIMELIGHAFHFANDELTLGMFWVWTMARRWDVFKLRSWQAVEWVTWTTLCVVAAICCHLQDFQEAFHLVPASAWNWRTSSLRLWYHQTAF